MNDPIEWSKESNKHWQIQISTPQEQKVNAISNQNQRKVKTIVTASQSFTRIASISNHYHKYHSNETKSDLFLKKKKKKSRTWIKTAPDHKDRELVCFRTKIEEEKSQLDREKRIQISGGVYVSICLGTHAVKRFLRFNFNFKSSLFSTTSFFSDPSVYVCLPLPLYKTKDSVHQRRRRRCRRRTSPSVSSLQEQKWSTRHINN